MATRIHHLGLTVRPTLRRGAWQLYDEENEQWHDHWLITSGTRIVEFISSDLEMTDARMAIVGEKLLNADIK